MNNRALKMNLIDLVKRNDKSISVAEGVSNTVKDWNGSKWRIVSVKTEPQPAKPQLTLRNFSSVHPLWTRPETIGWYAATLKGTGSLEINLLAGDSILNSLSIALTDQPTPIRIPWPLNQVVTREPIELTIKITTTETDEALIYVHRALSRQHLYDLAKGKGVEIGPGPNPQIHNSTDTHVLYLEETPAKEWTELYDKEGKFLSEHADWSS
jgi:hypothetical protein